MIGYIKSYYKKNEKITQFFFNFERFGVKFDKTLLFLRIFIPKVVILDKIKRFFGL